MHEDIYRCKALLTIDYKIRIGIFGMSYYCNGLKAIVWFMAFIITIPFLSSEILQNPTGHQEVPLLDVIPNDIHVGTAV